MITLKPITMARYTTTIRFNLLPKSGMSAYIKKKIAVPIKKDYNDIKDQEFFISYDTDEKKITISPIP